MLKKLLILILVGLIGASAYLYWGFSQKRTLITPYPYSFLNTFDENFAKDHAESIRRAENSKILIVGDRMGKSLDPYTQELSLSFKDALKTPPTIYNWSEDNEGLFRTIHKLKMLKKIPPVIIYFGASSELFEKKFDVLDKKKIEKNFNVYDDEKLISLIITFPWISNILYQDIKYFDLAGFTPYNNFLAAPMKIKEKELYFKIFEYETKELIEFAKEKKSNLIFITTPINLEVEPKEVCAHSSTADVIELQQEIAAEVKEGAYKSSLPKSMELAEVTPANARTFYLLGLSAMGSGDKQLARESLSKAAVFDCSNWRGGAVYNSIIKSQAQASQVQLVDFDQYMTSKLSDEGLFFDEIMPQNIFYQSMIKELGDIIKKTLSINE